MLHTATSQMVLGSWIPVWVYMDRTMGHYTAPHNPMRKLHSSSQVSLNYFEKANGYYISHGISSLSRLLGTSVSVTCLLYPTGANFTATLDNVVVGSYNTAVTSLSDAQTKVIFTKDGLDSSAQHTLVLQKTANDPGWVSSVVGDAASHLNLDSIT